MESPLQIGDVTANSILNRLGDTHLNSSLSASVNSVIYSGQKFFQLTLTWKKSSLGLNKGSTMPLDQSVIILRRVQDSYVNISQLLHILVKTGFFNESQVDNFLKNEILTNSQYTSSKSDNTYKKALSKYDDFTNHKVEEIKGLWIPYDKSVNLALKFDLYEYVKKLFLIDVHDFESFPRINSLGQQKRGPFEEESNNDSANASLMGSPTKKQKLNKQISNDGLDKTTEVNLQKIFKSNVNHPFTLPPIVNNEKEEIINQIKLKFGEVFNNPKITFKNIKTIFQPILNEHSHPFDQITITDVPLDDSGKTALHFAATLGSLELVSSFIKLCISSPIRGDSNGESPLISAIQVTNSKENGNFPELLNNWLWPNLWLLDHNRRSFLHHLVIQPKKNFESTKYYLTKILEWILSSFISIKNESNEIVNSSTNHQNLFNLCNQIINLQDKVDGNTALHLAAEQESKWLVNILLKLNADVNLKNKMNVKPIDFKIVSELLNNENSDEDDYITNLVQTSVEFLKKRDEVDDFNINDSKNFQEDLVDHLISNTPKPVTDNKSDLLSNKIFQSIQDLLSNTNAEYENIINTKKKQVVKLNKQLHDSTLMTANNRYMTKKIIEKLSDLDNLKLQMTNINDKCQQLKKYLSEDEDLEKDEKFNADETFIIEPIYEKLINNEEIDINSLVNDSNLTNALPSLSTLKARTKAYEEVNKKLQSELNGLSDYSELTSKFKKVVSFCTGVDINEVDELLDGLLEAVESQQ